MSQILYIKNKKNEGVQYSRNIGIIHSKGEFVAFLDDDDIWLPTKIEKQLSLFGENVGMVYCGGENFYDNDINKRDDYYNKDYFGKPIGFYEMLENGDYIGSTSQVIVRKCCFARTGLFDCDFLSRQDYEMWLRISKNYEIKAVEEPLFLYREHKGARVSTNYSNLINGYENLLRKYRSQYKKVPAGKCMIKIKLANCYLKTGKYFYAMTYLIHAFILSPSRFVKIGKSHS
jgi:glycosyltransferase involved in cell wall biosynthesis